MFASLVRELVLRGSINTTLAKAKAVRGDIDKIMTQVRGDSVAARRRVLAYLGNDREITQRLFSDFSQVVKNRRSGFTRITSLPPRRGDNAELAKLEWVEAPLITERKEKKKRMKKEVPAK